METLPNNSAFPEITSEQDGNRVLAEVYSTGGLTIRAYMATKLLAALVSLRGDMNSEHNVESSVKLADQLITELNKEK